MTASIRPRDPGSRSLPYVAGAPGARRLEGSGVVRFAPPWVEPGTLVAQPGRAPKGA